MHLTARPGKEAASSGASHKGRHVRTVGHLPVAGGTPGHQHPGVVVGRGPLAQNFADSRIVAEPGVLAVIVFLADHAGTYRGLLCRALFIPSYLTNEPRHTTEIVTLSWLAGRRVALWHRFCSMGAA